MTSTELEFIAEAASSLLQQLEEATKTVQAAKFTDQEDESRAVFLAGVKAAAWASSEALRNLVRRAQSAASVFGVHESFDDALRSLEVPRD